MPRITVTSDAAPDDGAAVLLDVQIGSAELAEDSQAMHFIERLGWAISDAEDAERPAGHRSAATSSPATSRPGRRRGARLGGRRGSRRTAVATLLPRAFA
jgi:hypothetical protein